MSSKALFAALMLWILAGAAPARAAEPSVAYLAHTDGYWQVWRMAPDGTRQAQVTRSPYDKSRLTWYPDGQQLLVNGSQGELARVDTETGEEQEIRLALGRMSDAALSPDGRTIAFSLSTSDSVDDNNIWLLDLASGELKKMTNMKHLQHEPSWSPDSSLVYFLAGRGDQTHDIWRLRLADGSLEQLTTGQLYHFDVAVSPDGILAFSSNRSGNYEIWTWFPGSEPRQLTRDPALDAGPTWSPDGKALLFESTRAGMPNIWKIGAEGGDAVQITKSPGGARRPVWSHGDRP